MCWASYSSKYYTDDSWYAADYGVAQKIHECLGYPRDEKLTTDAVEKTIDTVMNEITWSLERLEPERAFICLDSGDSERKIIDPNYKRMRSAVPAEYWGMYQCLLNEIDQNFEDKLQLCVAQAWEADDCMATIAKAAVRREKKCVMMCVDKDMRQCMVPGKVNMQRRVRNEYGVPSWQFYRADDAATDWNCEWTQFLDMQVLAGDATDRVKGCHGVGLQTASTLLEAYGSVEKMKTMEGFPIVNRKVDDDLFEFLKKREPIDRSLVRLRDDLMLFNPMTQAVVIL
jgi:5'-3' exonuclease